MEASEVRQIFLDFFASKQHEIVSSAPMVVKNDPTLMFINAGMNQFKDYFLGNRVPQNKRVTDTQKCLRVSGKHNDLEEVGHDTYHHTMFEMLGNWSFGDYFKKEAIAWAWELLTDVYKIDKDRLYVTIFGGDEQDNMPIDTEAFNFWKEHISSDRILHGSKKDNFWEMGDTGPCGPCSEIHIDLRDEEQRQRIPGDELVNKDHPLVIEIWNLVFIQFNRMADSSLAPLPSRHVDTGMGFERLCMVLQNKKSNYDTDVFQPIIQQIALRSNKHYGNNKQDDIAMRVIADHLRAITFAIADGQLPSNVKAGYVIRRILRRAVRYAYTFLGQDKPFINELVPLLAQQMGDVFPELIKQQELIRKVITEEEISFLRTLEKGIQLLDQIIEKVKAQGYKVIKGSEAFELYDTYGFPFDLTELILREQGMVVSKREFDEEMDKQKARSRKAATTETDDWVILQDDAEEEFIGYDQLDSTIHITRYRKVKAKNKELYQLVFNFTPFYAESGGQVGDTGIIFNDTDKIEIIDTKKENNLIIHLSKKLPKEPQSSFKAQVSIARRDNTANNHTATHLLHQALREVLGDHVEQKGSLVHPDYLRFDFSHFQKLSDQELAKVEQLVNQRIRANFELLEKRAIPIEDAHKLGATMLFGEKYGDLVRVIQYGDSIELCGGTHVKATGQIGHFHVTTETSIAAGIRRIEAVTGVQADEFINEALSTINQVKELFNNPKNLVQSVEKLREENQKLQKDIEALNREVLKSVKQELKDQAITIDGIHFIGSTITVSDANLMKDLAFQLRNEIEPLVLALGAEINGKANLALMVSDSLHKTRGLDAGKMIREVSRHIKGGGGGQPFFATAGGKEPTGLPNAIEQIKQIVKEA